MERASAQMLAGGLCTGQLGALADPPGPASDHRRGQLHVELERVGTGTVTERLVGKDLTFGEQRSAGRQVESLMVEVMDAIGPGRRQTGAGFTAPDRVVADLDPPIRIRFHRRSEMAGHHLAAKTEAEKRGP